MKVFGFILVFSLVVGTIFGITFCESVDRQDWNIKYNACSGDTSLVNKSEFVNDKYVSCGPCCEIASFPRTSYLYSLGEKGTYPLRFTLKDGTNVGVNLQMTLNVLTKADALKCMAVVNSKTRNFDNYCQYNLPTILSHITSKIASNYNSCEALYSNQVGFRDTLTMLLTSRLRNDGINLKNLSYLADQSGLFDFPDEVKRSIAAIAQSKSELIKLQTDAARQAQEVQNLSSKKLIEAKSDSASRVTRARGEYEAAKWEAKARGEQAKGITPELIRYEKAKRYKSTTKIVTPNGQVIEVDKLDSDN